ncbi:MAG: methionyl-tRNA formyltransferase [Candidatus Bipolaricaulaceae bacterium]
MFAGSGGFAVPTLEALAERGWVELVVTQPDRPAGRGLSLRPPPVKQAAERLGLPLLQTANVNAAPAMDALRRQAPDALVVAAFGQILRGRLLELPSWGCVNVHASLLPNYRGAAPVAWAILRGERETGVTTMFMDRGVDTGPILLQRATPIGEDETRGELEARLAALGAELAVRTVEGLAAGELEPTPQPEGGSLAPPLTKQDGRVDWTWDAARVHSWIRGMQPWPGAFTSFRGRNIKLLRSRLAAARRPDQPPGVLLTGDGRLWVSCGQGAVELLQVQPAGRRAMGAQDFVNGYRVRTGDRFA